MSPNIRFFYTLLMVLAGNVCRCMGQTYGDVLSLYADKMSSDKYSVDVRPILNQSHVLHVYVSFELVAIVELNDVRQSFNCNGLVLFFWTDQILVWDPKAYGGQKSIHPQAKNIWRPRVILGNTIEDRDIFADDNAPVTVLYNGSTSWFPGSIFPTSCALDMRNYPFDEQHCYIYLPAMGYTVNEFQFIPLTTEAGTHFYTKNGVWEVVSSYIDVINGSDGYTGNLSGIVVTFHLKRNPDGILINILLPVVFLSFLNLWVFVIPVESGEKIGYGTTVLMALSVFMTTMSAMLPGSSEVLPNVVVYMFILLIISLLTVITSIVIVFLHHKEEKEENHILAKANFDKLANKVTLVRKAVSAIDHRNYDDKNDKNSPSFTSAGDGSDYPRPTVSDTKTQCALGKNRYKIIGKYIDLVSLIVFSISWLAITLGFLFYVSHPPGSG